MYKKKKIYIQNNKSYFVINDYGITENTYGTYVFYINFG